MVKFYNNKSNSLKSIVRQIFSDFNLSREKKIFIKPNLGGRYPIINGENTRYDILRSICEEFQKSDCREIIIGHTSLLNFGSEKYNFDTLIKRSKIDKLIKLGIVKLINLDKSERENIEIGGIKFSIPKVIKTHFYINLCNLKTHMETGVSLSLKNQIGLLPANERMCMHRMDLDRHIAYLGKIARPNVNIIDGRIGMEGNGPHHGLTKRANLILCGDNAVEVDSVACFLMSIESESVKHIKLAISEGIGHAINNEEMSQYKKFVTKFRKPSLYYGKYGIVRVWPNKACSGCIFSLSEAHKSILRNPIKLVQFINKIIKTGRFDVVMGSGAEGNAQYYHDDIFAVGNCTKSFSNSKNLKYFLPGCPPDKNDIMKMLTKNK